MVMTPKKRVMAAILGGRVDRVPATAVCQTATHDQMEAVGAHWPEAHLNAEKWRSLLERPTPLPVWKRRGSRLTKPLRLRLWAEGWKLRGRYRRSWST